MRTRAGHLVMWFAAGLAVAPVELAEPAETKRGLVRAAPSAVAFVAWRAGNERAGNELFLRYRRQLVETLRRVSGRADVDDETQDVLVAVLANREACANSSRFEDALLTEVDRVLRPAVRSRAAEEAAAFMPAPEQDEEDDQQDPREWVVGRHV